MFSNFSYPPLVFITLGSLFSMPRIEKIHRSPAKLICPVEGCRKVCRTHNGLTQHLNSKHKEYQPGTPPSPPAAAVNDYIILDSDLSSDSDLAGTWDAIASGPEPSHDSDGVGFDFDIQVLPSSQPGSPSRESEASGSNADYHPTISGQ
jgi:hypothetical protein